MVESDRTAPLLNKSLFMLQVFDSVADLASTAAAIPGIKIAASLALSIVTTAKQVKTNAEECLSLANQCTELVVVVAEATRGQSIEDADPQLPADLAGLINRLEQIRDRMLKQTSHSTLHRLFNSIEDSDNIAKCKELLNQCYQIFQVQSSIALRRYWLAEERRRLLPQPLLESSPDASTSRGSIPRPIKLVHGKDAHPSFCSNSPHPIMYNSLRYPTALHLFWALKIPSVAEKIRKCGESVDEASKIVRNHRDAIRADWPLIQVAVCYQILLCKFTQYPSLFQELQGTGNAEIINDSADAFWGTGKDRRGKNELGKALMRLRHQPPWPLVRTSPNPSTLHPRRCITLYRGNDSHPCLRNDSPHPIMYNGSRYPTALHLFWALKVPTRAEQIRTCSKTNHAGEIVRSSHELIRPDWSHIQLLANEQVLLCKFLQYPGLIQELLGTEDAEIVCDEGSRFWGVGKDGSGRNELGKALERLRATLRIRLETLPNLTMVELQK